MIRLKFIGAQTETYLAQASAYFRIAGGVVWTRPEYGPLAAYSEERWRHREVLWSGLQFEGQCRLVFGISCDPAGMSEPLQSLSIDHRVLSANGIPFAVYEPARDMWHGAHAGTWWHAFRVESIELRQPRGAPVSSRGERIENIRVTAAH